jgi:hypothetical protein
MRRVGNVEAVYKKSRSEPSQPADEYFSYSFKSRFVIKTTADRKMSTEKRTMKERERGIEMRRIIVGPFPEATT